MLDRFVNVMLWAPVVFVVIRCAQTIVRRLRHAETVVLARLPFPWIVATGIVVLIVVDVLDRNGAMRGPPHVAFLFAWLLMTTWHSIIGVSIDEAGIDGPAGSVPWKRVLYAEIVTPGGAGRLDYGVARRVFGPRGYSLPVRADVLERAQQFLARVRPPAQGAA